MPAGDHARGGGFVPRIRVRVQEDDGDRIDARPHERTGTRRHLARVQPPLDGAVRAQALPNFQPEVARHERLRLRGVQVVQLELALAADLERVAEALGGDEPGHGAATLDQRVGEQRRRVHDPRELLGGQPVPAQQPLDTGGDGARGIVVRGEDFAAVLAAARVIVDDDVGERPADVDPERVTHFFIFKSSNGAE